jgi:hypothetical protein
VDGAGVGATCLAAVVEGNERAPALAFRAGPSLTVEHVHFYGNYDGVHFYGTVITIDPYIFTIDPYIFTIAP